MNNSNDNTTHSRVADIQQQETTNKWFFLWNMLIDRILPSSVNHSDTDLLRRTRLTASATLTLIIVALLYAGILYCLGSPTTAMFLLIGFTISVIGLICMRTQGSALVGGNILTFAIFFALTGAAYQTGGFGSIALPWYAIAPLIALSTAGRRSSLFWTVIAIGMLSCLFWLDRQGYTFPMDPSASQYKWIFLLANSGLIVIALILVQLHDSSKSHMYSELKIARTQLQNAHLMLENSPVVLMRRKADPDLTVEMVTENIAQFGYIADDFVYDQLSYRQLIHPDDRQLVATELKRLDKPENERCQLEYRIITKAGRMRWLDDRILAERDECGRVTHYQGIVVDITERRQVADLVRYQKEELEQHVAERTSELIEANESLSELKTALDCTPDCIFTMGLDGNVTYVNQTGALMHGYEAGEIVGQSAQMLVKYEQWQQIEKQCLNGTAQPDAFECETLHWREDGSVFPCWSVAIQVQDKFGKTTGGVCISRDISERKQAEIRLQKAKDAAEVASRAKSTFLANMSHEIRTPLTAVLGFTDILLMSDPTPEETRKTVLSIQHSGRHLLEIINDVLDLSKIEADRIGIEYTQCEIQVLLLEVQSLLAPRAREAGLDLRFSALGRIPAAIQSDSTRLRQILINLISNALKFTDAGNITVEISLLGETSLSPQVQFRITDTGMGIPNTALPDLFKPFSQVDASTTRQHSGTGLGLSISKQFANLLGGDITVESILGKGSTFTLTIATGPLDNTRFLTDLTTSMPNIQQSVAQSQDSTESTLQGCRILLAEDVPENQVITAFILEKAGAFVAVADNGSVAVEKALAARDTGSPFDVILMDIQMPVLDGCQATLRLRASEYYGPIIALTAHAMASDRAACIKAGCNDFATKPVDPSLLVQTIRKYYVPRTDPQAIR